MADDISNRLFLSAVIHAGPAEMRGAGITEPNTAPLLMSAHSRIEALLKEDPDSTLAYKLRSFLEETKRFYVVGPWPPIQGQNPPVGGAAPPRVCGVCGRDLP